MAGEALVKGVDYFIDPDGRWVFTAAFLLKRGYCCGSGCRHCPYLPEVQKRKMAEGKKDAARQS